MIKSSDPLTLQDYISLYDIEDFYLVSIEEDFKIIREFDAIDNVVTETKEIIGDIITLSTNPFIGTSIGNKLNAYKNKSIRLMTYSSDEEEVKTIVIKVRK